jgi:DNA-binding MarR family transcriptional regulator
VGRLNRFARLYFRKAVELQEGVSLDDFGLLQGILLLGRPRVSDVLHLNMMEPTTGSAALKRLMAHGWVAEEPNPQDGRSKLLSLTPEGRALVFRASELLGQIGELFVGPLAPDALNAVVVALRCLDDWHTHHHDALPPDLPFADLRRRMLASLPPQP